MTANACLTERIEKRTKKDWGMSQLRIPFERPLSPEESHALATDFSHHLGNGGNKVVENLLAGGARYDIMPEKGDKPHYVVSSCEKDGGKGIVYVIKTRHCQDRPGILMDYSPNGSLDALMEARKIHAMLNNKARWAGNIAIGLGEIIGFWPAVLATAAALGLTGAEEPTNASILAAIPMSVGWMYCLTDGLYRIGQNVSILNAGVLEKIKRKNPTYCKPSLEGM